MASARRQAERRRRSLIGLVAVAALIGAGVIGGLIANATQSSSAPSSSSCAVTSVADKVLPSVVTISVSGSTSSGVGSGSVIRANGYILTNNHVIAPAASGGSLRVLFSNGTTVPASIVGRDPLTDLAVIKVTGVSNLPVISLGSTSDLRVGDPVIALGAPLGYSSTVTSGIVSALDRTVSVPGESSQPALLVNAVQTDAAINPGNSGGALVDCSGRLVGVPSAGASVPSSSGGPPSSGNVGLGFAIPVDLAKTVSDEIIATGRVQRSYIGLDVEPIGSGGRGQNATGEGLLVTAVDSGGPAGSAGLQTGDVITKIDDRAARTTDQLVAVLLSKRPGDSVTIVYDRQGRSATTRVTLGRQP